VNIQVVLPLAGKKVWVLALNPEPFHHLPVVVSSMATDTLVIVDPSPEFDEAVPVITPVQSAP
jgi:hypothetical protein